MAKEKRPSAGEKQPQAAPSKPSAAIAALLDENRTFPPAPDFTKAAHVRDDSLYQEAAADFEVL